MRKTPSAINFTSLSLYFHQIASWLTSQTFTLNPQTDVFGNSTSPEQFLSLKKGVWHKTAIFLLISRLIAATYQQSISPYVQERTKPKSKYYPKALFNLLTWSVGPCTFMVLALPLFVMPTLDYLPAKIAESDTKNLCSILIGFNSIFLLPQLFIEWTSQDSRRSRLPRDLLFLGCALFSCCNFLNGMVYLFKPSIWGTDNHDLLGLGIQWLATMLSIIIEGLFSSAAHWLRRAGQPQGVVGGAMHIEWEETTDIELSLRLERGALSHGPKGLANTILYLLALSQDFQKEKQKRQSREAQAIWDDL